MNNLVLFHSLREVPKIVYRESLSSFVYFICTYISNITQFYKIRLFLDVGMVSNVFLCAEYDPGIKNCISRQGIDFVTFSDSTFRFHFQYSDSTFRFHFQYSDSTFRFHFQHSDSTFNFQIPLSSFRFHIQYAISTSIIRISLLTFRFYFQYSNSTFRFHFQNFDSTFRFHFQYSDSTFRFHFKKILFLNVESER